MIGPWLAAKTPTRSAMGGLFPLLKGMQARHELGFRHATDLEVEPQQVGVDARRDRTDVVFEQRLADFRFDFITADDGGHVGAEFRGQLPIVLEIEKKLAQPVVRHRRFPLSTRANRRVHLTVLLAENGGRFPAGALQSEAGSAGETTVNLRPAPFTCSTRLRNSAAGTFSSLQITIWTFLSLFAVAPIARSKLVL